MVKPADEILQLIHKRVRNRKEEEIKLLIEQSLSIYALFQLRHCLRVMNKLDSEIEVITDTVTQYAMEKYPREFEILYSVPGIGEVTAFTLIAEIGTFKDFSSADKLASWLGIVPRIYQSADHNSKRSLPKRGSRLARWVFNPSCSCCKCVFLNSMRSRKTSLGKEKQQ